MGTKGLLLCVRFHTPLQVRGGQYEAGQGHQGHGGRPETASVPTRNLLPAPGAVSAKWIPAVGSRYRCFRSCCVHIFIRHRIIIICGYGILDKDGNHSAFDAMGNQIAVKQLQNTDEKDHLRVNVSGKKKGDTIQVKTLKMM